MEFKGFFSVRVAVVRRVNDNDDKLVVVAENTDFSNEEIEQRIEFQEKWFEHILLR